MEFDTSENLIYFGSSDGIFYALDATSGIESWRYEYSSPTNYTSATVSGGYIYFGISDGYVFKLMKGSGTVIRVSSQVGPVRRRLPL